MVHSCVEMDFGSTWTRGQVANKTVQVGTAWTQERYSPACSASCGPSRSDWGQEHCRAVFGGSHACILFDTDNVEVLGLNIHPMSNDYE
jgi:hypothetical protein